MFEKSEQARIVEVDGHAIPTVFFVFYFNHKLIWKSLN